jgi:hypothetical protein
LLVQVNGGSADSTVADCRSRPPARPLNMHAR